MLKVSLIMAALLLLGCRSPHREAADDHKVPISITNSTNRVVKEFKFSYRRGPVGSDMGRVEGEAFDIQPNEVRWVRVDSYPEGSVRLSAQWKFTDEPDSIQMMSTRVVTGPYGPEFQITNNEVGRLGN